MTCSKCAAEAGPDEKFCAACGASLAPDAPTAPADLPPAMTGAPRWDNAAKINKARKWLLGIAILTCLFGIGLYFVNMQEVDRQVREAKGQLIGMSAEQIDAAYQRVVGMTFQEAIDHDRGMVRMLLFVNLGLTAAYVFLWWWAKRKPLPATVIALMLFITLHVVNAVIDPKTLGQGILVKILFTLALARAVGAAAEDRRAALAR
jgi:hypothetical protein